MTLGNCLLSLSEEAQVPAQEAGVLVKIPVREGQQVAAGDLLAQIDDLIPQQQYNVAKYKLKVAKKQANDDVDVRYAAAAYLVAKKKLEKYLEANAKTPGTIPETEVDLQRLERDKFLLSYEKAQKDLAVAGLQKQVSEAELQAADVNVKRRKMTAPLDAVVVELSRHEGEWVQARRSGDAAGPRRSAAGGGVLERHEVSRRGNPGPAGASHRDLGPRTTRNLPRKDRLRQAAGGGGRGLPGPGRGPKPQRGRRLGPQPRNRRGNDNPIEMMNAE